MTHDDTSRNPEARHGSAGARPSAGGLGAISGPPAETDAFELYDLRVEVIETGKPFVMHAKPGDTFDVIGGRIVFPPGREASFSLYAMLAVLPFIPAKQRPTHPHDWMTTDTEIASPDPHCGARLRITRLGKRRLRHSDYSALPLAPTQP